MINSNSYRVTKQTVLYNVTFLKQKMKWGYEMTGSEEKFRKIWTPIWTPKKNIKKFNSRNSLILLVG